jgi:hypothetical protein
VSHVDLGVVAKILGIAAPVARFHQSAGGIILVADLVFGIVVNARDSAYGNRSSHRRSGRSET